MRQKANTTNKCFNSILDQESVHGKEMAYRISKKIAEDRGMVVFRQDELQLTIEEIVTLRDIVGMGTYAMSRFASGIAALRRNLFLFLTCMKALLAGFNRYQVKSVVARALKILI